MSRPYINENEVRLSITAAPADTVGHVITIDSLKNTHWHQLSELIDGEKINLEQLTYIVGRVDEMLKKAIEVYNRN